MPLPVADAEDQFWAIAGAHVEADGVAEGTMMGSRCLRVDDEFTAMIHTKTGELIVKLSADRVTGPRPGGHRRELRAERTRVP